VRSRLGWRSLLLDAWPAALALALVGTLLVDRGWPLARDLMFVPHQPWTLGGVGLTDATPRAVPLDAVVSAATWLVDGGVLARVVLPVTLATAGWGVHRLLAEFGTGPRLVAGGLAVWNPYVVERLALGQWALLLAYAALPWLVMATHRYRRAGGARWLASVVLWSAVASLTPTGGILALATILVVGSGRSRRLVPMLACGVLLQLPWVVPAVTGASSGTSDPAGVAAFAARGEGPGGPIVALLGLGGIWDRYSMPATRGTWLAPAFATVVVVGLVVGWPVLRRLLGAGIAARAYLLGTGGLLLASLSSVGLGADLMRWAVEAIPGAGLLRDSQKFLAPFVILAVLASAATVKRALDALAALAPEVRLSLLIGFGLAPIALLPDGATTVWRTVDPVIYPAGFEEVAAILDPAGPGDLVTLPWRSYRRFTWGNGQVSADPATRWFNRETILPDDLEVGDTLVRGENSSAQAVGAALAHGRPADVLAGQGVAWVLVYLDDPDAGKLDLSGLRPVHQDSDLALYAVPGHVAATSPDLSRRELVAIGDLIALALVAAAAAVRPCWRKRADPTGQKVNSPGPG